MISKGKQRLNDLLRGRPDTPIVIVSENIPPMARNEGGYWVANDEKSVGRLGRSTYVPITATIEVGRRWLFKNLTDEELAEILTKKLIRRSK
jgi:hypothetical protein